MRIREPDSRRPHRLQPPTSAVSVGRCYECVIAPLNAFFNTFQTMTQC